jgi:hypothetical protein
VIGITMLKVRPGHEKSVYGLLREMEGIKDVYHLFGEYDFFVIMQAEGMKALDKLAKIVRGMEEVTKAWQMLVTKEGDLIPSETHIGSSRTYIQDDREPAYS